MTHGVIFPELVSGRVDEVSREAWVVREGSTMRGSASCNLSERVLEVPLERSEVARVVRAHELMHARVSPHVEHLLKALDEVTPRALECSEELRVNVLLERLHFDVAQLKDGTEKQSGRRVGESADWAEAVCFYFAILGTGAEKDFLTGLRQSQPTWIPALRAVRRRVFALIGGLGTATMSATTLSDDGLPSGYAASTLVLARLLTNVLGARVPVGAGELGAFRRSLEEGGRRPASGRFAPLVFNETLDYIRRVEPRSVRRSRGATTGTVLRYPSRLLTDPHRRAFVTRRQSQGGIVLLDQSGSMDLAREDLEGLLRQAPGALVVGYSHRPGDRGGTSNIWILAQRGRVATRCPAGNVGNGVDGLALRWALDQRRGNEPVVWVTDGQVTDSNDHPDVTLTQDCVTLLKRHHVRLVRELAHAPNALRTSAPTPSSQFQFYGRVGRALRENTVF